MGPRRIQGAQLERCGFWGRPRLEKTWLLGPRKIHGARLKETNAEENYGLSGLQGARSKIPKQEGAGKGSKLYIIPEIADLRI